MNNNEKNKIIRLDKEDEDIFYQINYKRSISNGKSNFVEFEKFNIQNPEIYYQEEEFSKLVNMNKSKIENTNNEKDPGTKLKEISIKNNENEKYNKLYFYQKFYSFFKFPTSNQNNLYLDLSILLLFLMSVYLYIGSLGGCFDTQTACLVNLSPQFFHNIVSYLTISSIINATIIYLIIKNSINKLHLIYIFIVFGYLTLHYDTGSDLAHHGAYNRIVFLFLILISISFISYANFLVTLLRNKYFKLIGFKITISLIFVIYVSIKISDCSKWNLGLNKKNLINNLYTKNDKCYISSPRKCWIDFLDGILDISWYLQEDCQNFRKGERTELLKYLPERYKNTYSFGYPITTKWKYVPESYHMPFFYNLMKNFIDLNNSQNNNKTNSYEKNQPEIILRFDEISQLGKIDINIKKNLSLIEERTKRVHKIREEKIIRSRINNEKNISKEDIDNIGLVDNVLFIYIDSISRQHFLRKMKGTIKFMEKYFKKIDFMSKEEKNTMENNTLNKGEDTDIYKDKELKNENYTSSNLNFYQFLKYHAFIYFTQPNVNPMFYGESMTHNNGTHIIKYFHERGFISAQSNNICSRELYDIEPGFIENLTWEPFDHENIALFCDPNYFNPENPFTPYMGPYSIKKRCLYGRNTFEYVLDYGEKFWEVYKKEKKFLRLAFQDAHEGTGEVARYLDDYLYEFLNKFEKRNWLENTAIFIVSDHGNNMIGFYNLFNCEDFIKEKTLATWFMLLPSKQFNRYDDTILENENIMITPYDIFDTLISLIIEKNEKDFVRSRLGESVITEVVNGEDRTCKRYKLDLLDIWCRCNDI